VTHLTYIPRAFWRLSWGDPVWVLPRFSASETTVTGIWRCLRDPTFSRFSRTPICDRQMGRRTDRHTTTANRLPN